MADDPVQSIDIIHNFYFITIPWCVKIDYILENYRSIYWKWR